MLSYDSYSKYFKYINKDVIREKYRDVFKLYLVLEDLQTKIPNSDKTLSEFQAWFYQSYPAMKADDKEPYDALFAQLAEVQIETLVANEILTILSQRSKAAAFAALSWDVSEGRKSFEELRSGFASINETPNEAKEYTFVTNDLNELENATVHRVGLRWPLACLNSSLGSLRVGDFGFLFARPERGKTTFLAHTGTFMAEQAKRQGLGPVIWFNNEEQGEKVQLRCYEAHLGSTIHQVFRDKPSNGARYQSAIGDHLRIIDDSGLSRHQAEDVIEGLKPSLIIFDQIDKVKGFKADRPDLVFGEIYQWAREWARKAPVIGVCQASGSGEGVKWLTMEHVAEAKTSKQAEADWILGIGASNEAGTEHVRCFNISKNKLVGDEDSDPALRHGRFEVLIKPEVARYEDILV